jgi:hypothetical protein
VDISTPAIVITVVAILPSNEPKNPAKIAPTKGAKAIVKYICSIITPLNY